MPLGHYLEISGSLKLQAPQECRYPHRAVMLIAVPELVEEGVLRENKIIFSAPLLDLYVSVFAPVNCGRYKPSPYLPFVHLKGTNQKMPFWHLVPRTENAALAAALRAVRSARDVLDNFAFPRWMSICSI